MSIVKISPKNSKLGRVNNLNFPPCFTCIDMPCKDKCYARKAYVQYPNVREAWNHNYKEYTDNPKQFVQDFIAQMKNKKKKDIFRWHSSGEIMGQRHLDDLFYIATQLPETRFLVFTKKYNLDYSAKPDNFVVIFSAWPGLDMPEHIMKNNRIAFMLDKEGVETRHEDRNTFVCPGVTKKTHCDKCQMCWNIDKIGKDVVFPEH